MGFISRVRLLEANGYAARKNFVKKKYKDDTARKDIELSIGNHMRPSTIKD